MVSANCQAGHPHPSQAEKSRSQGSGFYFLKAGSRHMLRAVCHTMVLVRGTEWARPAPFCQPHSQAPMPSSALQGVIA